MNEKYAVDPVAFNSALEFRYLLEKFGFDQGRFLAEYPKKWRKMLFDHIVTLPDVEQMRIKRVLECRADRSMLRMGLPYDSGRSWVENAVDKKAAGLFTEVFAGKGSGLLTLHDIDDEQLADSRGVRVVATAKNLLAVAEPLLQCSMEVFLIDPYITLGKPRYLEFFQALLASPHAKDMGFVFFARNEHFVCKESPEHIAQRELLPYMQMGSSARFVSLNDNRQMHGRYMFSIKGALKYDKGFQVDGHTLVDIEVVSKNIHNEYFTLYNDREHEFDIVGDFTVRK